jgi:hypothetical protein
MDDKELAKLDFPIATEKMLISTTAMLVTVLQNQMDILKALNPADSAKVEQLVNNRLQQNIAIVESDLKQKVPESFYINYPKS